MLETFFIKIEAFEEDRRITVYLPTGYEEDQQTYPVLYMHDGQNVFGDEGAIGGVSLGLEEYLEHNRLEVIVVAIDQNASERINEYCPWKQGELSEKILGYSSEDGGKGEQYVNFIVNELKPVIDTNYRTDSQKTAIAGISLGGLISVYAACKYPQIFKHVVVFSSAFWRNQERIEELIKSTDLSTMESFYMDCGNKEGKGEFINQQFLASNLSVYRIVREKLPTATFVEIKEAEHHYRYFRERVPNLFRFLK